MYTVELLPPLLSFNLGGILYKPGVTHSVDWQTAHKLAENPRFHVTGLHNRTAMEEAAYHSRPKGEALLEAIRSAADAFGEDNDDNWDRSGKPSLNALSKALGYLVSSAERDRALGFKPIGESPKTAQAHEPTPVNMPDMRETGPRPASGQLETADGRTEKTSETPANRIVRNRPAQTALKIPADIVEDPSKDGAISG